jgi:hypothetical protein
MRVAFVLSALLVALPVQALGQGQPLRLFNAADADSDGVVTDDERADYLAKKAAAARDEPGLPVAAPRAGGNDIIIMGRPGAQPGDDTGAAGEPPAAASDFEKSTETRIRKDRDD